MTNFFGDFLGPAFPASHVQHISDMHSKFALGHTTCRSTIDIQSATLRLGEKKRRKKKEIRRKKPQDENIMECPIAYAAAIIMHNLSA